MKKSLFITMLSFSLLPAAYGQLSLTSATHQYAVGDSYELDTYDTIALVPRNTGANQTWDFSACLSAASTSTYSVSYVDPSTLSVAVPTGSTLAQVNGTAYQFYAPSGSDLNYMGYTSPTLNFDFSGAPVTYRKWSLDYQDMNQSFQNGTYTSTDPNMPSSGVVAGRINYGVSGHGTLIAPDGEEYTDVLQVVDTVIYGLSYNIETFTVILSWSTRYYNYYVAGEKYPVISFGIQTSTAIVLDANNDVVDYQNESDYAVTYNEVISTAGINEQPLDNLLIYPNPAKDEVYISGKSVHIQIASLEGKTVVEENVSGLQPIDLSHLPAGTYVLQLTDESGNQRTERLVKQ